MVRKNHQNNGHTGSLCLDKPVLGRGGGGGRSVCCCCSIHQVSISFCADGLRGTHRSMLLALHVRLHLRTRVCEGLRVENVMKSKIKKGIFVPKHNASQWVEESVKVDGKRMEGDTAAAQQ